MRITKDTLEVSQTLQVIGDIGFHGVTPVSQHNTNGATAGAAANSGPAVLLASAFSGGTGTKYTISDIVKCLKDVGLLAP